MKEERLFKKAADAMLCLKWSKLPVVSGRDERRLKRFERRLKRTKDAFDRIHDKSMTLKESSGLVIMLSYKQANGMQNIEFMTRNKSTLYSMLKALALESPSNCALIDTAAASANPIPDMLDAIFDEKVKDNPKSEAEAQPKPQTESEPAKDQAQQPAEAAAETEAKTE